MRKVIFLNIPHPVLQQELEAAGYDCEMAAVEPREEIQKRIGEYFGIIINSRFFLDRSFLEQATSLRFIGRVGSGMESIDTAFAESKGIRCFNSPEGNCQAVGEHALGLLLGMMNHIPRSDQQVRHLEWKREENRGNEVHGKTIGIIGYGNTGSAFSRLLRGFETTVLAYDKYKSGFSDAFVKESSLQDIFEQADIISFHVPLTPETRYYLNEDFISQCRKPFWLLNTSRGKVVETQALVKALHEGRVLGAGLDVLEYEDISFEKMEMGQIPSPLKELMANDKVVLTPHVAGWTKESKVKLAKVLAEKILAAFPGEDRKEGLA